MEGNNNSREKTRGFSICQSFRCKIMVPVLVILFMGLVAITLVNSFQQAKEKKFVILAQQGIEVQRIALEPWKNKISEVPIWYQGNQYILKIEVKGRAARLINDVSDDSLYLREEKNMWIHDSSDIYTYRPLELKLYFE